jgi:uncharacterized protein
MNVAFPYAFDALGRTADATEEAHVRQLLEQLLFTAPGERVNRPTFGTGVLNLIFTPSSPELAAATQLMVQGALQQWLSEVIAVEGVDVRAADSTLSVTVRYLLRRTQERRTTQLTRPLP